MFSQLMSINRLLLLFSLAFFVISGADRVRAADVTITPSDLMPTEADPDATPAVDAKSAQQKVMEKIMAAGPGDTVSFPGGSYKDVGEILIATGGEPADNPETTTDEGDGPLVFQGNGTTFTGKIMFNVKAPHVVIRGFRFMNTLVPDVVTIKADGDDSVRYGFPGVTVEDFLKDESRVGDAYTGGASPTADNVDDATALTNNAELWVVTEGDNGAATNDIANKETGVVVTDTGTNNFAIWGEGITSAKAKNSFGTVWVDSVIHSGICQMSSGANPVDIQITGVVVRNNMFSMTEVAGVRAGSFNPLDGANKCNPQVDVIGNTFMNIGVNTDDEIDGFFAKDSRGDLFRDGDMNLIADIGNREPAIDMMGVRAAMITDNTLGMAGEGDDPSVPPGTSDAIAVRGAPKNAAISISNNRITSSMLNGILISDSDVESEADDAARITVSGNVISGTNANRYLTAPYSAALDAPVVEGYLLEKNRCYLDDPAGTRDSAAIRAINKRVAVEMWRSRIDRFFPGSAGAPVSLPDSAGYLPHQRQNDQYSGSLLAPGNTDLVRYRADRCFYLGSVKVVGQEGVRVTNNDLGWMAAGGTYSRDALDYGVVVERGAKTTDVPDPMVAELKAFKGNNINFHAQAPVQNAGGKALSVAGNYFGGRPVSSSQLTGSTEAAPIGPTDEDPRVVGPREDFINPDLIPPTISTAEVSGDGTMLTLTYNDDLDEDSTPSAGAFTVERSPAGRSGVYDSIGVNGVKVDGRTVTLTLAASPKIEAGDTVTVTYNMPSGTAARIQDMAGDPNPAPSQQRLAVTNNVGAGGDNGDNMPASPAGGGDGGCALASAGDDAIDLGMLLLLTAAPFAFAPRTRKAEENRSGV